MALMDVGLARTGGMTHATISLADKRITLNKPAMVEFFGQMEAFILSRKTSPERFAMQACRIAPPAMHESIWAAAAAQANKADSRMASNAEIEAFTNSPFMGALLIYMCMDESHQQELSSLDKVVGKLFEDVLVNGKDHFEEQLLIVREACGIDDLKNSDGQRDERQPLAGRSKEDPNSADGRESTGFSPTVSGGSQNK